MNEKDEALKMAIEYIEKQEIKLSFDNLKAKQQTLVACKEALEQPAQEPVAWIKEVEVLYMKAHKADGIKNWKTNLGLKPEPDDVPLYTHPAQPLSDVELSNIFIRPDVNGDATRFARAIEQAHGIGVKYDSN